MHNRDGPKERALCTINGSNIRTTISMCVLQDQTYMPQDQMFKMQDQNVQTATTFKLKKLPT